MMTNGIRNGAFFLFLFVILSTTSITHALECSYLAEGAGQEFSSKGKCGEMIDPDRFLIYQEHLKNLSFTRGPAAVIVDDKVFYLSKGGKTVRTWMVDNGADYFSEGLARTVAKGKFGYIDKELNVVITPLYDFAFPFHNGVAVVCNGCSLKPGVEHQEVEGGLWGTIDRSGKVLIPLEHSRTGLMKMINGKAWK
jgi:hypothetical protein